MKSPFLVSDNTFETSSDFAFALSYLAKCDKDYLFYDDLVKVIKKLRIYMKYDVKILTKYIINANYTDLKKDEIDLIKQFFILIDENSNGNYYFEEYLHSEKWSQSNQDIMFAYFLDQLYYYNSNRNINGYEATINYIFKNNNDFSFCGKYRKLEQAIQRINNDYYEDYISDYLFDNNLLDAFEMMEIETFGDLLRIKSSLWIIIFSRSIDKYIDFFNSLSKRKKDNAVILLSLVQHIREKSLKVPVREIIFNRRYGIGCKRETLEQIASEFGLTRERIRQQEKKVIDYIKEKFTEQFNNTLHDTIRKQKIEVDFLDFDEVKSFIENDELSDFLRALIELLSDTITYDKKFNILYFNSKENTMFDSILNLMPYYITVSEAEEYNGIDYKLITDSKFYKKVKDHGYLKAGYNFKDIYSSVIDELYPSGFKKDDAFIIKVNEAMKERFDIEPVSDRAMYGIIDRCDYCTIDKATFINRKLIAPIPDTLKEQILFYMSECDMDAIYYSTIYSKFEKELNDIGVNNRYYLKGLIDVELPSDFIPQKDYISLSNNSKSALDAINEVISSMNGLVDLKYLRDKFPGVGEYTFINQLYQREDVLLYSYGNQFVKVDYSIIEPIFDKVIVEELEKLFDTMKYPVITSSKLFSKIKIFHPELLENNLHIDNQYVLYSYLEKRIRNYHYRRPYISKDETIDLNGASIISNYVDSLDYFNSKIIESFCSKMHLRNLNSYLDFIIEKSDKFIQVDVSNCIKKEKINLDNSRIEKIVYELDFYLNSFGPIDSRHFVNFDSFPYVGYKWSKYLLVGIIRGFLNDKYVIEYTDVVNTKTDYIIRRA